MTQQLQAVLQEAQKLTLMEQLELIQNLSQVVRQRFQHTLSHVEGASSQTPAQWLRQHPPQPVADITSLVADFWPDDESADDVIAYVYQQRAEDRLRDS